MYSICFYCVHCISLLISFKSGLYFYFCNYLVEFVSGKNPKQSYPDLGIYPLNQYTSTDADLINPYYSVSVGLF